MLDDHARGLVELGQQLLAGVEIKQVVERDRLAAELGDLGEHVRRRADLLVVGGPLVRVLAVGQLQHLLERAHEQRREVLVLLLEPAGDRGVVARGVGERGGRQRLPRGARQVAARLTQLVEHGVIALRRDDRRRVHEVLGGGADHRRAADVDVLDHVAVGDARLSDGPLERVQVHADEIDELDRVLLRRLDVLGVVADREQTRVQLRVQRLDAAVHDLRKARQVGDRADRHAGARQLPGGAAGGDDLDPEVGQAARELDDAGLVGHRQQRPADLRAGRGFGGQLDGIHVFRGCHAADSTDRGWGGRADQHPARVGRIEADRTVRDQHHGLHQQLVLDRMQLRQHLSASLASGRCNAR